MLDYIKTMLLVAVFYIMYIKISYCGWKWLKRYLVLSEAVILAFLLRTFGIGLEDFIEWVIYQICFLIFVILKYKKDKKRKCHLMLSFFLVDLYIFLCKTEESIVKMYEI